MKFTSTSKTVDTSRYMGTWYVWAGRTTFFERNAYNSKEIYTWNEKEKRIDVKFTYNSHSFDGPARSIPQKAWVDDEKTHARWKIQFIWPFKFNYLIIDIDPDYQWAAVGVPNGSYLWIMGRTPLATDSQIDSLVKKIESLNYPVHNVVRKPQR